MWMPSTPGTPVSMARLHGAHGFDDDVEIVADERRQETGRAEAAMRAADRADGIARSGRR